MLIRCLRDDRGGTAVEFAVVAFLIIVLIVALLEIGFMMVVETTMEGAARAAARQIRTGVVQGSADPVARFRQEFCDNLPVTACTGYFFDVRTFPGFAAIALPAITFDPSGNPQNATFAPGGARQVVAVRVLHTHRFMTPPVAALLGGPDGSLRMVSTVLMETEPFGS